MVAQHRSETRMARVRTVAVAYGLAIGVGASFGYGWATLSAWGLVGMGVFGTLLAWYVGVDEDAD